jgi:hypothetical protein
MVLNTRLLIGLFIIFVLCCVLSNNTVEAFQDNYNMEHFDDALDNVVKTDDVKKDYITNWTDEFKYKDAKAEDVLPEGSKDVNYADFTTDGKNYYNNLTHFDSADLLPKPDKETDDKGWTYKHGANWDESNPQIAQVEGNAWLNERKFLGIYTVGSTLRNATHDIRRDIPNPQMVVSPWNNTTILPDSNSKGLCTL